MDAQQPQKQTEMTPEDVETAILVSATLHAGQAVSARYTASFTVYDFVFTPRVAFHTVGERIKESPIQRLEGDFVIVTLLNFHRAFQFRLLNRTEILHPSYVAEKFELHPQGEDAKNISDFLQAICDA